jgi:assimilatory nitrate reductase catalytic subunit
LFQGVETGEVKALRVMANNPAASMPDANQARRTLEKCDFLVVSDCVAETDTSAHADVLLPALAWGEKEGTVTNSERRISRQRAFLDTPGEAQPDWWIVSTVARRLGYAGFDYPSTHEIFTAHARLSTFETSGDRGFDRSGLADLAGPEYNALAPVQWPGKPGETSGRARLRGDGAFFTSSRRARCVAVTPRPDLFPYTPFLEAPERLLHHHDKP